MRGRGDRTPREELENQVVILRIYARRLWDALRQRNAEAALEVYFNANHEGARVIDPMYDAAERIYDQKRIFVVPCRTVLDYSAPFSMNAGWAAPLEMYLGRWPDGSTRNLTRDQVLMMAGMDPSSINEPSS